MGGGFGEVEMVEHKDGGDGGWYSERGEGDCDVVLERGGLGPWSVRDWCVAYPVCVLGDEL